MPQSPKVERARLELLRLGQTARHVAESLRKTKSRGVVRCADGCPVAVRLSSVIGDVVTVSNGNAYVFEARTIVPVELPRAVRTFVQRFDRGEFEDLSVERKPA